jgi:hypothetical protein
MVELLHRRADDTFVIKLNDLPYHVTKSNTLYAEVAAVAVGMTLPPEPDPPAGVELPPPPQPTRAELMARLLQIQAQIQALEE